MSHPRPKLGAVFATGAISYRTVSMIVARTHLALEPEVLAAIDDELAETITSWGPLSLAKTEQAIDALVERHDPAARRRTESVVRSRYVDIDHRRGTADLTGELYCTDATLLDRRLTALAHTVCDNDPRTIDQRRADAPGALAAGHTTLACACGASDCPVAETTTAASVVVHVVADARTLDAADTTNLNGEQPEDGGPEIVDDPERFAELIREATSPRPIQQPSTAPADHPIPRVVLGRPVIPANVLADLAARGAVELRPLIHPGVGTPEPRYRPSAALAEFVRCRDMTCRFPNCDRPAEFCDLDHTIPYQSSAARLTCLTSDVCAENHLLKTFWTGPNGWHDRQLPDGTVIWTSPSGQTYRTQPGSKLLIPALCVPTGELPQSSSRSIECSNRGVMMPKRKQTRADERRYRIMAERNRNSAQQRA